MSIFKRGKHAKDEESNTVKLSAESIQRIADGVRHHVTFTHEDVQNWPEYKEWRDSLKEPVELSVEIGPLTLEPDYNPDEVAFPKDFNAQEWADERLEELGVNPFELELDLVLEEIRALLLEKNASYGDSALNPVRIMSDADAAEQIRIRMDDKLSRLYRGFAFEDTETGNPEDTLKDLVGYYFLLKIAEARNAQS